MRTRLEGRAHSAVVAAVGLSMLTACAHSAARAAKTRHDPNAATAGDWRGQPVGRVEELFAGRFPGVEAYAVPGGMVVRVRGVTTVMGDATPLYVIDGITVMTGSDGLVAINPADVARIEVLKDAAELAGYGSRAGNGVVRITTKRPRQS